NELSRVHRPGFPKVERSTPSGRRARDGSQARRYTSTPAVQRSASNQEIPLETARCESLLQSSEDRRRQTNQPSADESLPGRPKQRPTAYWRRQWQESVSRSYFFGRSYRPRYFSAGYFSAFFTIFARIAFET